MDTVSYALVTREQHLRYLKDMNNFLIREDTREKRLEWKDEQPCTAHQTPLSIHLRECNEFFKPVYMGQ